jgi:hypothetical protein
MFATWVATAGVVLVSALSVGTANATTALMINGTGNGNPTLFTNPEQQGYTGFTLDEMKSVLSGYFVDNDLVAVETPEQFWRFFPPDTLGQSVSRGATDLDAAIKATAGDKVVYGVSQGALVIAGEQEYLLANADDPMTPAKGTLSFVVEGNPVRPNGGLLTRFPWLASIPLIGLGPTAAPTETPYDTIDVAVQYDAAADFPQYPLNLVADLNAIIGFTYLHPNYTATSTQQHPDLSTLSPVAVVPNHAGGTTTYYLVPTPDLPLLKPLRDLGVPEPIADRLNTALTPVVEAGYDRDRDQVGVTTPAQLIPRDHPKPLLRAIADKSPGGAARL